jgi:hypothetical protein
MDYSVIRPGSWYKVGTVIVKNPPQTDRGMTTQRSYSDCHVLLADGWCYIEVVEPDGEGSVNAYPADQIAAVVNLYDDSPYGHMWPDSDESARAAVVAVLAARAD